MLCCDEFEGLGARLARPAATEPCVQVLIVEPGLSEAPADVYARRMTMRAPAAPPAAPAKAPRMSERFIMANREWYPGLCKQCGKTEDCTLPKPPGGVFACDKFE